MDSNDSELDAVLGTDAINKIYIAVLSGNPDPIGSDESKAVYDKIKAEVDAASDGTEWVIPTE